MSIRSALAQIQADLKYFRLCENACDLALRTVNRFVGFKAVRVVALSEAPLVPALPANFKFKMISEDELRGLAQISDYSVAAALLEEHSRHPDNRCYGIYDGERLAQYLFNSNAGAPSHP